MEEKYSYKYTDYSAEQIINNTYKQAAELILNLATTEEIKEKVSSILYDGGVDGFGVNISQDLVQHKDSPFYEAERRLQYAYFLVQNPEAFDAMSRNNTNLFHGTKIDALPGILKYGINSLAKSVNEGIDVNTGEVWSRIPGKNRAFISVTDSISVGLKYASLNSLNEENKDNSFGVLIGVRTEALDELDAFSIDSDVLEIGIMDHIPLEHIKVLTVPKEKVDYVKKLVGEREIEVVGADMDYSFYRMSRVEKIQYLMNSEKTQQSAVQEYEQEDMQKNAKTGKLSRIMKLLDNIKERFSRKDNRNYGDEGR